MYFQNEYAYKECINFIYRYEYTGYHKNIETGKARSKKSMKQ